MGIPVTPSPVLLFYHKEIFQRDNLAVPQTWDDVADLAERYANLHTTMPLSH